MNEQKIDINAIRVMDPGHVLSEDDVLRIAQLTDALDEMKAERNRLIIINHEMSDILGQAVYDAPRMQWILTSQMVHYKGHQSVIGLLQGGK